MSSEGIKNVFLFGASGNLGQQVAEGFLTSPLKYTVYVLVRPSSATDEKKKALLEKLKSSGARLIESEVTVEALTKVLKENKIDAVVSTVSGAEFYDAQVTLLDAIVAAGGVKRFIPSEFGASLDDWKYGTNILFDAKQKLYERIVSSGVAYTRIYTSLFLEYLVSVPFFGLDLAHGTAVVPGDGTQRFTVTSTRDIGRLVPEVLADAGARNKSVRLASQHTSYNEAIQLYERLSGKKLAVTYKPLKELSDENVKQTNPVYQLVGLVLEYIAAENGRAFFDQQSTFVKTGAWHYRTLEQQLKEVIAQQ